MYLDNISISHFRNIARADLVFKKQYTLITGDNAQGKTNLLEALHYLLTAQSIFDTKIENILQFNRPGFFVKGNINKSNTSFESVVSYDGSAKRVMVDNKPVKTLSAYMKYFSCISFSSLQMDEFLKGPAYRRKMLDRLLMQFDPSYISIMKIYYKALKSRNILLKDNTGNERLFEQYTSELIEAYTSIMKKRLLYINSLKNVYENYFSSSFSKVTGSFRPALFFKNNEITEHARLSEMFHSLSEKYAVIDRKLHYTCWGLSRTDFLFYLDNRPVLNYASRGQLKLIIILLFLIHAEIIRKIISDSPILLIDDLSGEMGDSFIGLLLYYFDNFEQVFIANIRNDLGLKDYDLIIMDKGHPKKRG